MRYRISAALIQAIQECPLPVQELARHAKINPTAFSSYKNGLSFGPKVKEKMSAFAPFINADPASAATIVESLPRKARVNVGTLALTVRFTAEEMASLKKVAARTGSTPGRFMKAKAMMGVEVEGEEGGE